MPWKPGAERNSPSNTPEYRRNYQLMKNYGITSEDYDRMLEEQGGVCAICKSPNTNYRSKYFVVDHDHDTGAVRGLLCHKCNIVLGQANDDITILTNAAEYIRNSRDTDEVSASGS